MYVIESNTLRISNMYPFEPMQTQVVFIPFTLDYSNMTSTSLEECAVYFMVFRATVWNNIFCSKFRMFTIVIHQSTCGIITVRDMTLPVLHY